MISQNMLTQLLSKEGLVRSIRGGTRKRPGGNSDLDPKAVDSWQHSRQNPATCADISQDGFNRYYEATIKTDSGGRKYDKIRRRE